ncbi:hypothetical protein XM38_026630 [Halomicronema hongdechloris C2206]|uniref:Uncharacterized protein n=1 Tax=Halomicronema hongdechloris C2206 TaxID=1641165 RepID=A0A1Z3HN37_9CYAN|nr:hypothetical protein XM38_026630 [Halomicronema hongdechloris C2206]
MVVGDGISGLSQRQFIFLGNSFFLNLLGGFCELYGSHLLRIGDVVFF